MSDWKPKVVALDIDGTLLKWVEGSGATSEVITPAVVDAVGRAYDAGAHIVLASGRSPHGMTRVADLLGLPREGEDRLWIVASNGAVIVRYPPLDVVHEELFDAGPAVRAIMREQPSALVAIEERGRAVARLADDGGVRGAHELRAHLARGRDERLADDRLVDKIELAHDADLLNEPLG